MEKELDNRGPHRSKGRTFRGFVRYIGNNHILILRRIAPWALPEGPWANTERVVSKMGATLKKFVRGKKETSSSSNHGLIRKEAKHSF